ncbi:hypothetical protein H3147_13460 [Streptomyces sp. OF8]|uniref:Lipoprotein n=2 Tax=Streptomyces alkaliterrae TaxID=2213162 RepID=A0A5P0YYH5_9ACTN|nr:hypothetical protein [Streptomyces alkaliterrae]MBB1259833.1 hypothetical protein [Streptomyces alkaliterrae]MQS03489.1 hypothetical protein [Streptomyces alkaliterrae]
MSPRRAATTTAVVVLTTTLTMVSTTACTVREDGALASAAAPVEVVQNPLAQVRSAADVLTRAGTSRTRTAMEMASGGTRLTITAHGDFDYRKRIGRLTVVLPDRVLRPVTEVITPGTLYMKNRGAGVPDDKWVRVDTTELSDGNLVTGGVTDPLTAAELLRGALEVDYLGTARVAGAAVRHYRGTTDLAAAARAAAEPLRQQLTAAARGFATSLVPFDAYLDDAGRLRKVRHEFVFDNSQGQGVKVASTTSLYGFGTPVRITMPERAEIYTGRISIEGG